MTGRENFINQLLNQSLANPPATANDVDNRLAAATRRNDREDTPTPQPSTAEYHATGETETSTEVTPPPSARPPQQPSEHLVETPRLQRSEDDMNPRHELAEVRRHLDDLLERARLADARSGREHATGGDDEGVVTAVVNGHGELVGLHIDKGARMASRRLGAQLATAVQRARQSALGKAEEDRRSMFPELPPDEEIERIFEAPTWVSDFHHIDYRGSALVRDAIAESIESFGALQEYVTELTRSRVRQEIGVGAGTVDIDATGTDLIIEIERDAPRNLGPERLAEQTLAAIRSAMAEAERRRGDVTRRLRSPGSRRMVHEHTMEW